jgi:hypothetical protein
MSIIQIYKGNNLIEGKRGKKVIAFDLDETLGSFSDLYYLWLGTIKYCEENGEIYDATDVFNNLMKIYPEFLRPGIKKIMTFIYKKKLSKECAKVFLYTNNQAHGLDNSKWLSLIINYFNDLMGSSKPILFDKIISAFKINNKIIEPMRTTHDKTYSDFIQCAMLPKTTEICFIDNTYYENMLNNRVYFIVPSSYNHNLKQSEIIKRYSLNQVPKEFMCTWLKNNRGGSNSLYKNELLVSQKIMYHIKEFFLSGKKNNKTKKIPIRIGRFTRRKRRH